jgi:hypothetical protein
MVTAAQAETGTFCWLMEFAFSGGTDYYTTAAQDVLWSGNTYTALGGNLSFEGIEETFDLQGQGVRLKLDGVDQTIITAILAENFIGRSATIYLAHFAADGTITADPEKVYTGLLNTAFSVEETGDTCTVSTFLVSDLTKFSEVRGIRANLASHQDAYASDTFFRHITGIAGRKIQWGPDTYEPPPGGGGGGGPELPHVK